MYEETFDLLTAVADSCKHDLSVKGFDDRLIMQKGVYVLNSWGYGPVYCFNMYVHGPYSSSLADVYYHIGNVPMGRTNVPEDVVTKLTSLFDKGLQYIEAYATVLMIKNNSRGSTNEDILERALELKPHLKDHVQEAAGCLLT